MYNVTDYDFTELKRCFDQNDIKNGAQELSFILDHAHLFYVNQTHGTTGNGITQFNDGMGQATISLDPEVLYKLDRIEEMHTEIKMLKASIADLQKMHSDDGEHVPTIVRSKEQYEALEGKVKRDEKLLFESNFDNAKVLF